MEQPGGGRLRVLMVDDSSADVLLVKEAFRDCGLECDVEVAEDVRAAIARLDRLARATDAQDAIDLVLLDLKLPGGDGTEVLRHIRLDPKLRELPVFVLSGSQSPADREGVERLGATVYFRKPENFSELLRVCSVIRDLWRGRKTREAE
ncbi:MAG TPA: response regulator [Planctomycetota bacterium]|nr:response regulator [Planctomycetota bacterium]